MPAVLRAVLLAALLLAFPRAEERAGTRVLLPAPPAALLRALAGETAALAPGTTPNLATRLSLAALDLLPHPFHRSSLGGWAPAVAALAGGGPAHAVVARALIQDVYERLHARPDWAGVARVAPLTPISHTFHADYPGAILAPSPNEWPTKPHHDRLIRYVVIHDTEAACAAALNWLVNPHADASAHFLICRDGRIYQLVRVADAAWHAGNPYINRHSIGIEHEGYAGGSYTRAQYEATASILRWLNRHEHLGLQWTRDVVMGHENVPGSDHTDPGPGWDWPEFMSLLRGGAPYVGGDTRLAVVLWPRAYVYLCPFTTCTVLGTANWGEQFAVRAPGRVAADRLCRYLRLDRGGANGQRPWERDPHRPAPIPDRAGSARGLRRCRRPPGHRADLCLDPRRRYP